MSNIGTMANVAAEVGTDIATQEAAESIKAKEQLVRDAAMAVVNCARNIQGNDTKKYLTQGAEKDLLSLPKKMVKTKEQYKDLMNYVFDLQIKVNDFLGQEVQMVFVYVDPKTGQATLHKVDHNVNHLKMRKASKKKGGGLSGSYRFNKAERDHMTKLTNSLYDSSSLDSTFSEVYYRFQVSKRTVSLGGAAYIMWREGSGWSGVRVSGGGPLAEAYAAFFLNEYVFGGEDMENNVKTFMTHSKYGATNVDATSGFLQGDITKGNVEYGIKSMGASAMGFSDIVIYAQEILVAPDLMTYLTGTDGKGGLKQALREKGEQTKLAKNLAFSITKSATNLTDAIKTADIYYNLTK